jgi:hypothetical protein
MTTFSSDGSANIIEVSEFQPEKLLFIIGLIPFLRNVQA